MSALPNFTDLEELLRDLIRDQDLDAIQAMIRQLRARGQDEATALATYAQAELDTIALEFTSALEGYRMALAYYEPTSNSAMIAQIHNGIARGLSHFGRYDQVIEHLTIALDLSRDIGYTKAEGACLANLAAVYGMQGDIPRAIPLLMQALAIHERVDHKINQTITMRSIGVMYSNLEDHERASHWFKRSLDLCAQVEYYLGMTESLNSLGMLASKQGDYQLADAYLTQAIDLEIDKGLDATLPYTLITRIGHLLRMERYDEADDLLRSHPISGTTDVNLIAQVEVVRGRIAQHRGDYTTAMAHYDVAFDSFANQHDLANMVSVVDHQRSLAKATSDFEKYVQYNEEHQQLSNELAGAETARRIAIQEKQVEIDAERAARDRERTVLYSTLPQHVADRVIRGEQVTDHFEMASVLFLDIVGFTTISDRIPAGHVVHLLKAIFDVCDEVCKNLGLTRIKTIGDSYLAVAGVPVPLDDHAQLAATAALEIQKRLNSLRLTMPSELGETTWTQDVAELQVRIGLHCGPIVAGVVGDQHLQYDVWGDTVNTASRMESTGEAGRIQVSAEFHKQLSNQAPSNCRTVERGTIDIKGKGSMTTYWLEGV